VAETLKGPAAGGTGGIDPKDVVTATAFRVSPDLLGLPLASHTKRVLALLIDLALIGLIANQVGGVILGFLAAIFFLRIAVGSRKGRQAMAAGTPAQMAMQTTLRGTAGCVGATILFVTAIVFIFAGPFSSGPSTPSPRTAADISEAFEAIPAQERERLERLGFSQALEAELEALGRDPTREDVEAIVGRELAGMLGGFMGVPGSRAGAMGSDTTAGGDGGEGADASADGSDTVLDPDTLPDLDTIPAEELSPEARALDDSVSALLASLEGEREFRTRAEERAAELRREVRELQADAEEGPGIRALLLGVLEDLGVGVGWGALYYTVFLTLWKGRTPGKRVFRLRVVRLDQGKITWWTALERYGGYAAGFATGLLGFLQVFWDPNRQATHDKIAGTVVVQEGRPPLPGFGNPADQAPG
jgi:hypothetical protein